MDHENGHDCDHQIKLKATVKQTATGGEILTFPLYLGPIEIVVIANIPEEGRDSAPVYVKFKFKAPQFRPQQARNFKRPEKPAEVSASPDSSETEV